MYVDKHGQKWYKGNLHTHTSRSDGKFTYEDACRLYADNGYDFLCVSDHWKYNKADRYENMLILAGCEYDVGTNTKDGIYHIVSIGAKEDINASKESSVQQVIDAVHEAHGIAMLAHPVWSLNSPEDIMKLRDVDLSEIFNSVSDLPYNARPDSSVIFDIMAAKGHYVNFTAVDDTHFYEDCDKCRSFVYVKTEEFSEDAIKAALLKGDFYCSQGPVMETEYKNGKLTVNTTPAERIVYYTATPWNPERSQSADGITHGEFVTKPADGYVRVEVMDKDGKKAWSQYVEVNKIEQEK